MSLPDDRRRHAAELSALRMARRRARLASEGLKPWQIWVPDLARPEVARRAAAAANNIAQHCDSLWVPVEASRGDLIAVQSDTCAFAVVLQAPSFDALPTRIALALLPALATPACLLRLPLPAGAPRRLAGHAIALDRVLAIDRTAITERFGRFDAATLRRIDAALVTVLGCTG